MATTVEFLEEMTRKVAVGEITSFAVISVDKDAELSLDKSVRPEDQEMIIEGLQHLAFVMEGKPPSMDS